MNYSLSISSPVMPRAGMLEDTSICCLSAGATVEGKLIATPRPRRPTPPAELLRLIKYYREERGFGLTLAHAFTAAQCGLKPATVKRRHLLALRQTATARPAHGGTQPRY